MYVLNEFVNRLFMNTLLFVIPCVWLGHLSNVIDLFYSLTGDTVDIKNNDKG